MIIEKIKSDYHEYRKQRHAAGMAALSTVIGELGRLPNKTETDAAVLKVIDNVYSQRLFPKGKSLPSDCSGASGMIDCIPPSRKTV